MSEAVGGIVKWASTQQSVKAIVASTEKTNIPSSRVLAKNDFVKTGETENLLHWRLDLKKGE
jgi:RimJ/RimL family protein N-acetyltransferase